MKDREDRNGGESEYKEIEIEIQMNILMNLWIILLWLNYNIKMESER